MVKNRVRVRLNVRVWVTGTFTAAYCNIGPSHTGRSDIAVRVPIL